MPVQERSQLTRTAIIKGAAEVFVERGYASASLDLIVDRAAVTRGGMYFHFKSKEKLANAVIQEQHRIARAYAEKALTSASSGFEAMILMSAGLARQLTSEVVVRAGIRLTTDGSAKELSTIEPYTDWMRTFENLTRLAIEQGDFQPTVDPLKVARFVVPAYTGVQLVSEAMNHREDLFERVREMWELLLPGLLVPERYRENEQLLRHLKK